MFEEIPSRPAPPSQRTAIIGFAAIFVFFFVGSAVAWFRWSRPLSVVRKVTAAEFGIGLVVAGVCLLTARRVAPEDNQRRLRDLLWAILLLQIVIDVLR